MQVETELATYRLQKDTMLTLGIFDGLHLGHQHLLRQLMQQATGAGLESGVVTFRQHPRHVLSTQKQQPLLVSLEERIVLIRNLGVELVVPLSFTPELARLGAADFVGLLQKHLRMRGLVVGPDFALGHNREGDATVLRRLGEKMGFTLEVIAPRLIEGQVVSSTAIRQALSQGDVLQVEKLLGRRFSLCAEVVSGVERGRSLGFPTANLDFDPGRALPADGIYVTLAYFDGETHPSVTNIGKRPTFQGKNRTVEVYLLDFKGDLYGKELKIELVERLRGEKRFASADELKGQIARDVEAARAALQNIR